MEGVEEWCRKHLAGSGVEVRSGGVDGVTVTLPHELHNVNRILVELCDQFDVDVDAINGELGAEWKIVRNSRASGRERANQHRGCCARLFVHLAWIGVCVAIIAAWLISLRGTATGANRTHSI